VRSEKRERVKALRRGGGGRKEGGREEIREDRTSTTFFSFSGISGKSKSSSICL
jgi:hypothetical protein